MSYDSHRILPLGLRRKRKERETFYSSTSSKPLVPPAAIGSTYSATTSSRGAEPQPQPQPLSSNRLLAGYMAYEFLTKGTLFGQKFDPARAEAAPVNSTESKRNKLSQNQIHRSAEAEPSGKSKPHIYAEVANVLKSDGAHLPGVVNPTQLAQWMKM